MGIEIRGLEKSFGNLTIYRGFDLHVADGEVTVLLGPSGCGKTTLLELVAGTLVPDASRIDGIGERRCSYVFQDARLLPWMTVSGNIEFVLRDLLRRFGVPPTLFVTRDVGEALQLADDLYVLSPAPTVISARFRVGSPHGTHSLEDDELLETERRLYTLFAPEST